MGECKCFGGGGKGLDEGGSDLYNQVYFFKFWGMSLEQTSGSSYQLEVVEDRLWEQVSDALSVRGVESPGETPRQLAGAIYDLLSEEGDFRKMFDFGLEDEGGMVRAEEVCSFYERDLFVREYCYFWERKVRSLASELTGRVFEKRVRKRPQILVMPYDSREAEFGDDVDVRGLTAEYPDGRKRPYRGNKDLYGPFDRGVWDENQEKMGEDVVYVYRHRDGFNLAVALVMVDEDNAVWHDPEDLFPATFQNIFRTLVSVQEDIVTEVGFDSKMVVRRSLNKDASPEQIKNFLRLVANIAEYRGNSGYLKMAKALGEMHLGSCILWHQD